MPSKVTMIWRRWPWLLAAYAGLFLALTARRDLCLDKSICYATAADRIESAILFLWVRDWETIFAGALALAAALIAAVFIQRQIRQVEDRRERRYLAVRATMPLTLSRLCNYADACVQLLLPFSRKKANGGHFEDVAAPAFELPAVPADIITDLRDMIEACSPEQACPLVELLKVLQVQMSRLRSLHADLAGPKRKIVGDSYFLMVMLDSADLYARASNLFDFARAEDWTTEGRFAEHLSASEIRSALFSMSVRDDNAPELYRHIDATFSRMEEPSVHARPTVAEPDQGSL
ncbi:hypothetical protein [Brevundimonas sp.]|uniref:hypothetical protein n=1 Tax=Brevundimonas sp. TaxID=1871086 RepID=UPI002C082AB9|nr:hypothetical protein [Brevundimonas sp.]HWQ86362.1 hypothetical protein [Brevundimonas sp.]